MGWVMPPSHLDFLHLFTCILRNTITPASNLNMSTNIRCNSQHTRAYPRRKKSCTWHPALYMYAEKLERNFGIVRHLRSRRILHKQHGSDMNSRWRNGRKIGNPWRLQKTFIIELYACLEWKFTSWCRQLQFSVQYLTPIGKSITKQLQAAVSIMIMQPILDLGSEVEVRSVRFNWPGGISTQKWSMHDPIGYAEVEKSAIFYGKTVFCTYFTLNI